MRTCARISLFRRRLIEEACIFPSSNMWGQFMAYTLGPIGLSILILGNGFVLMPVKMMARGADQKDINATKEAAMSAFLALTYLVFPGSSIQIMKGLATDAKFDNDPEYFPDWQDKGAPKRMCRMQYDCE